MDLPKTYEPKARSNLFHVKEFVLYSHLQGIYPAGFGTGISNLNETVLMDVSLDYLCV